MTITVIPMRLKPYMNAMHKIYGHPADWTNRTRRKGHELRPLRQRRNRAEKERRFERRIIRLQRPYVARRHTIDEALSSTGKDTHAHD